MTRTNTRPYRRALLVAVLLAGAGIALLPVGCGKSQKATDGDPGKIKVAYLGLTCEAPIFVAQEKGLFTEQGLDVELVKTDWDGLREGLASGQFHANHTLVMYILKGVEKGSDFVVTGGVHMGCLRVQVGWNSPIKSVSELRGKRIGVPTNIGSPPAMFASRALAAAGIDPSVEAKEVTWVALEPGLLGERLKQGELDAVATSDPIGTILEGTRVTKTIVDQTKDKPYADEYCCAMVVNGEFARKYPSAAAKVTRAILKGSKWVNENPKAAAELGIAKNFISASVETNTQALMQLRYVPGVAQAKRSLEHAAEDMKKAKLLSPSTDPAALAKRAWRDLDGVTDEWVVAESVTHIEGARPPRLAAKEFAALFSARKGSCVCCNKCCIDE
jgi:NitT/TauT family transport system substrate-binding protein